MHPVNMEESTKPRLYTIQPIAGKGLGVIATSNIPAGTRIMSEAAILTFDSGYTTRVELEKAVMGEVNNLSPGHKAFFYTLHNHRPNENKELEILATNSLPAGVPSADHSEHQPKGIFPDACRVNHDCRSNATYTWNNNVQQIVVHAIRDIDEGEEITFNYSSAFKLRDERRETLLNDFGFVCSCRTCSLPQELRLASDCRLTEIRILKDYAFDTTDAQHSPIRYLRVLGRLRELFLEEGLYTWNAEWIYDLAFQTSASIGDHVRAGIFVYRAATLRALCAGVDDDRAREHLRWSHDLTQYPAYQNVGRYREFDIGPMAQELSVEDFEDWLWREYSLEAATRYPKVACFAAGLAIAPFERLPSDNHTRKKLENPVFPDKSPAHWCFIGEVTQVDDLPEDYGIVKDKTGQRLPILFNLDQQESTARLEKICPGQVIAVLYAERHEFENGTIGIRVDDAQLVKVFPFSLQKLYKLCRLTYSYAMEHAGERQCQACDQKAKDLKACTGCSLIWYCNAVCQKSGWTQMEHQKDCKLLRDQNLRKLLFLDWKNVSGDRLKFPL